MLPMVLVLALRPSLLPSTAYLHSVHLHKWISRLTVLVGIVHGGMYIVFYIKEHTVHKMFKPLNFLGVVAMLLMAAVAATSLKPVRRRAYCVFYGVHYVSAWLIVLLICVHARPGVSFLTFLCVALMVGQVVQRLVTAKRVQFRETVVSPSLSVLSLPRSVLPPSFSVGSHVRVAPSALTSVWAWLLPTHPYTIASLPSDDRVCLLVRRSRAKSSMTDHEWTLTGPYATLEPEFFGSARQVLIIAGGSGLSFAAPVYRQLKRQAVSAAAAVNVKLVWVVRDRTELDVLPQLGLDTVSVYITGNKTHLVPGDEDFELEDLLDEDENAEEEECPLDEGTGESSSSTLIAQPDGEDVSAEGYAKRVQVHRGRPDLPGLATDFFGRDPLWSVGDGGAAWVVACGPGGLVAEARRYCSGSGLQFHGESYAL